jgi:hypothetical protein
MRGIIDRRKKRKRQKLGTIVIRKASYLHIIVFVTCGQ